MATWTILRTGDRLAIAGELRLAHGARIWRALRGHAAHPGDALDLDLSGATAIDGAVMALLVEQRAQLAARGVRCELVGVPDALAPIVHLHGGDRPPARAPMAAHEHGLERLGAATEHLGHRLREIVEFAGELVASIALTVRRPSRLDWRALPTLVERAGADGVPIVLLLDFLVGFVTAYQATRQLKLFGANMYIADVVGVSLTRELVPLMTAIIMSGRSGAAFAAELGTMRVSEEVDALRTMGFAPVPYLVLPRVWALALVAPILTLLGDAIGIAGGLLVAVTRLEVTPGGYFGRMHEALIPADVWTGLAKSVAFGTAIALIGCQQGLTTRGAAQGVGRGTTRTVVYCLFTIVVLDTVFTMLFGGVAR
jgi:phospholipid/cholesterol/gamma-HCH transport system permease protein